MAVVVRFDAQVVMPVDAATAFDLASPKDSRRVSGGEGRPWGVCTAMIAVARLPDAVQRRRRLIDDSGHHMAEDNFQALATAIIEFLVAGPS